MSRHTASPRRRRGFPVTFGAGLAAAVVLGGAAWVGLGHSGGQPADASPVAQVQKAPGTTRLPDAGTSRDRRFPLPAATSAGRFHPAPRTTPAATPGPSAHRPGRPGRPGHPAPTTTSSSPAPSSPAPTTTTTSAPPPPTNGGFTDQVVALTNAERAKAGCGALTVNATLTSVAQAHSQDMATHNYFSHDSQDGRSPFDRMTAAGYRFRTAAENIAAGQRTPADVMNSWMNSAGHKANILNCALTQIGVGYATASGSQYGVYWTQDFGTPL